MNEHKVKQIRDELLQSRDASHGFWEIYNVVRPEYGPTDPPTVRVLAEGTYEEVVEYALTQPWFTVTCGYETGAVYSGVIKKYEPLVVRADAESLRRERIRKLEQDRKDMFFRFKELGDEIRELKGKDQEASLD
jgi:hypothetical protein